MIEHYEIVKEIFHHFDYSKYKSSSALERARIIIEGMDYILGFENDDPGIKKRFIDNVLALAKAHSLCITTRDGQALNDEISYFKAVKASVIKLETEDKGENPKKLTQAQINEKIASLMAKTIISEDVIDVYSQLGLNNPDISILSDEFLKEVEKIKYKNLAVEMLRKLIEGKIKYSSLVYRGLDSIKTKGEANLVEFIKDSNIVKVEFVNSIKKYFIKSFIFNVVIISLFLLGTYKFYYKETKENIEIVRDIIREDEKYWWDKENNVLYRYQNNPNIKNKK